jgi:hypothetical protein
MTAPTKMTGLIRPSNMDPQEYTAMYYEAPPDDLTLILFVYTCEERCPECNERKGIDGLSEISNLHDPESELLDVVKSCIAKSAFPRTKCQFIQWDEDDDESSVICNLPLEPSQDNWIDSDFVHVQVGFLGRSPYPGLFRTDVALYDAMNVYDSICVNAKSIDPAVQSASQATGWEKIVSRLAVNDAYAVRSGIWCEPLVALRNEVMVKVRATIFGEDPEEEWKKFCDAGFTHFLDYLKLLRP